MFASRHSLLSSRAVRPMVPSRACLPQSPLHRLQLGGNRAVTQFFASGALQPKLRIGAPGDVYEREADHVADSVLRMPAPAVQRTCSACASGAPCAECAEHEDEGTIQRVPAPGGGASSAAHAAVGALGSGRRLDAGTRAYFEPRFGASFDDVRVHTDANADRAASAVSARAFTLGNSIAFSAGEFAPHTNDGRRLLAHELTHVLQQRSAREPLIQRELVWSSGYPRRFRERSRRSGLRGESTL